MRIKNFKDYEKTYKKSVENPEGFWGEIAQEFLWKKPFTKVLEWDFQKPDIKWFIGGKLNITENCLDRHLAKKGNQVALIWEANDPNEASVSLTYRTLHEKVCQFANVLKRNGIKKSDRVCVYMPMIPELAIAILA